MINQVTPVSSGAVLGNDPISRTSPARSVTTKDETTEDYKDDAAFTVELNVSGENTQAKDAGSTKGLGSDELERVRSQADMTASALRDVVEKLIMKQHSKSPTFTISIEISGATGDISQSDALAAISEDGEWGVGAVSDRIVEFAKAVSGGDAGKLSELKAAIDKGFASAKKTLGGSLPGISAKTYDAVMQKLDDWANGTEASAAE